MPYTTVTFGNETLDVVEFTERTQTPGTIKQTLGGEIIQIPVPGKAREWRITFRGVLRGSTRDTKRTNLIALQDGRAHLYSDGLLSSVSMIIPDGGLIFTDTGDREQVIYEYNLTLVQFNQ